jgi:hypothetical protein
MIFTPRGLFDVMGNARTEDGKRMGEDRPKGLHLSDIVREMRKAAKLSQGIEGEQDGVRMQLGFVWEHTVPLVLEGMPMDAALAHSYKRYMLQARAHVVTQVQTSLDGVLMTPDAFDAQEGIIDSYKLTWKSMKKAASGDEFAENFWPWLVAEKAYCLAWGVDTTRFFIGWVNGDYSYKPGRGPQIGIYDCQYTEDELRSNWGSVMAYRGMMEVEK